MKNLPASAPTSAAFRPPGDCRRLFLRDLHLRMRIGAYDSERHAAQSVLFNVDLYVPLAVSTPRADQLDEVLDYNFIRDTIARRIEQGPVQLLETLCDDLLALMLAHPQVRAARVSCEKPDVYADCESVGVEVSGMKEPG